MRELVKFLAWSVGRLIPQQRPAISVLMYHRVTGDVDLELDLPYEIFKRQMRWLGETGAVLSYQEALDRLCGECDSGAFGFVLTFDDAYEDFYTLVWPLLQKYRLPAILFVPTEFIDQPSSVPISRSVPDAVNHMKPMTWDQIREVASDPLISIGAHTHSHPELNSLSDEEILEEIERSSQRFKDELGFVPDHFAYPRGIWNERVVKVIASYYESATIIQGLLATPSNTKRHQVFRVPVRRSDGWRWFRARARGYLYGEEVIIRMVKRLMGKATSQY